MKVPYRCLVVCAGLIAAGGWWHYRPPEPTVLSFRVGQPFQEVMKNSTYPVMERSNLPSEDPMALQAGETFVTEPAVIPRFDDPKHGFRLPPTKFALVGYMHNKADPAGVHPGKCVASQLLERVFRRKSNCIALPPKELSK
jgi:hypothetical protein